MTSSRQAGHPSGRGDSPPQAPQQRRELLSSAISQQIIPRLIQAHAASEAHGEGPVDFGALTGHPITA